MEELLIKSATAEARIFSDGGKLGSLKISGTEVLVDSGPKATRWGSFPMIPWCGRLAQGVLKFQDAEYEFEKTAAPHANHGFCHTNNWQIDSASDSQVVLSIDLAPYWDFGGTVSQTFLMDDSSITTSATVVNNGAAGKPMPIMIGWHPWFVRELDTGEVLDLQIAPESMYELGDDILPTGELVEVPSQPWDNCFIDLAADPKLAWGDKVSLTISSDLDHWVVFTEPEHALCVEPQSGPPNQSNSGPRILEQGDSFSAWMKFTW